MALKLFILGLPGSGKSTIARYIKKYAGDKSWEVDRFNDYRILHDMFLADGEHNLFKSADHGGFDIIDFIAFDLAILKLEHEVTLQISNAKLTEISIIEFARNDYKEAFRQFSKDFLKDAYFLYLDVDKEICKRRILERIRHPSSEDDFFVSEYIFNFYYDKDNGPILPQILESDYSIDQQKVEVIDNNGLLSDSIVRINEFVDRICDRKSI